MRTPEVRIREMLTKSGQCCTPNCINQDKVLVHLKEMQTEIDTLKKNFGKLSCSCTSCQAKEVNKLAEPVKDKNQMELPGIQHFNGA